MRNHSKKSELGHVYSLLPLHEMAVRFGLIDTAPRRSAGRKPYLSPEGKVAVMTTTLEVVQEAVVIVATRVVSLPSR